MAQTPVRTGLVVDSAMVVSAHRSATEVGVQVIRDGGNAVDAAVAVHWALSVVAPWAGNLGGGGFMVLRQADGSVRTLDFRETAPALAERDMYTKEQGANSSLHGHKAIGVPGSVAGLYALHDSLGKLPMERLIQPAIDLARKGFPLSRLDVTELNLRLPTIRKASTLPNAYTAKDEWAVGDTLRCNDLAGTLERIRDHGPNEFYRGRTARLIVEEMSRGDGLITEEDLQSYEPVWRAPLSAGYRDFKVYTMAPPSGGGAVLLQVLRSLDVLDSLQSPTKDAALVHRIVEAERRAFADRATYLGDPDYMNVGVEQLLTTDYITERLASYDRRKASPSTAVLAGHPGHGSEQTTHFSIVDKQGNSVSCTTTLNGWFGSGVVVGGAGFLLNNEMDDFSRAPGIPNHYGLSGGEANAIAPRKRMLSSMAPTIITRNERLYMVVGSPGGSTIPSCVLQAFLNVAHKGMSMQEAVAAPRFHHQWLPDTIVAELGAISSNDSTALVGMGHVIRRRGPMGRVDAILVRPDGRLEGGADPRGDDTSGGF